MADSTPTSDSVPDATRIPDLLAQATLKYSLKDYTTAAELYSRATELQAENNGEMSPENAEILYLYGRCLYHVAVKNSDVLGGKVASETSVREEREREKQQRQDQKRRKAENGIVPNDKLAQSHSPAAARISDSTPQPSDTIQDAAASSIKSDSNMPLFQFTGDENFDTDSEQGEEDEEGEMDPNEDPEEEEDDFANAFEVLDLARILLLRKLGDTEMEQGSCKGKSTTPGPQAKDISQLKERLADTYDLQAEISLEGERFRAAVTDLRSALLLKKELYAPESSLLAEAHFKLSLALEFSSIPPPIEGGHQENGTATTNGQASAARTSHEVDMTMRAEAATEMAAAISSCRMRIARETTTLEKIIDPVSRKEAKAKIADVKDMVNDMETRLEELQQAPALAQTQERLPDLGLSKESLLGALLSQGVGREEQEKKVEEAVKGARDLSGLVRKKPQEKTPRVTQTNGHSAEKEDHRCKKSKGAKRKVGFAEEAEEMESGKRVRVEDDEV
ncbi:MAG: hypothetical protein M1834_007240 [Cirrosporium novae-zelandiae]|nr:MAG: hypothetical protein M1834_007240 [Cirrosporium novae-zelandiae]